MVVFVVSDEECVSKRPGMMNKSVSKNWCGIRKDVNLLLLLLLVVLEGEEWWKSELFRTGHDTSWKSARKQKFTSSAAHAVVRGSSPSAVER